MEQEGLASVMTAQTDSALYGLSWGAPLCPLLAHKKNGALSKKLPSIASTSEKAGSMHESVHRRDSHQTAG